MKMYLIFTIIEYLTLFLLLDNNEFESVLILTSSIARQDQLNLDIKIIYIFK